jgi:hypothetical protein
VHADYARMVQHYQSLAFFEDFSLFLQLHDLPLFYDFDSIELMDRFFSKKNAAVRALTKKTLEFEVFRCHFLSHSLMRLLMIQLCWRAVLL